MSLGRVLGGFLLASGALALTVGAVALAAGRQRNRGRSQKKHRSSGCSERSAGRPQERDRFLITRTRSKLAQPKWVLQGFGRCQCFLLFDTWEQAMNQATFRLEGLGAEIPEFIQIQGH